MTERTSTILKMVEEVCGKIKVNLDHGAFEITAELDTTAPLKVLIENSISIWVEDERKLYDEPEEYFEKQRRYAMEEVQQYKELLTALKGLVASFSEYEAIFTLEEGIELIIYR